MYSIELVSSSSTSCQLSKLICTRDAWLWSPATLSPSLYTLISSSISPFWSTTTPMLFSHDDYEEIWGEPDLISGSYQPPTPHQLLFLKANFSPRRTRELLWERTGVRHSVLGATFKLSWNFKAIGIARHSPTPFCIHPIAIAAADHAGPQGAAAC